MTEGADMDEAAVFKLEYLHRNLQIILFSYGKDEKYRDFESDR